MNIRLREASQITDSNGCGGECVIPLYLLEFQVNDETWLPVPVTDKYGKPYNHQGHLFLRME